ncbi:hypothetical protein D3C79_765170 [compost metagenome]
MPHHQSIGIDLLAAQRLGQIGHALQIQILLFHSHGRKQGQCGLTGPRTLQPHVDGGQLELIQLGDVAIGPHHYGERLGMGREECPQLGLGLFGKRSKAMAGLIEPVGLDEGVGDLSRFQQTKILDGARAGLRLALQIWVTLASQSTELLDDLVIDPLLTPCGDDGGV